MIELEDQIDEFSDFEALQIADEENHLASILSGSIYFKNNLR